MTSSIAARNFHTLSLPGLKGIVILGYVFSSSSFPWSMGILVKMMKWGKMLDYTQRYAVTMYSVKASKPLSSAPSS